jgi:hypothetical protein
MAKRGISDSGYKRMKKGVGENSRESELRKWDHYGWDGVEVEKMIRAFKEEGETFESVFEWVWDEMYDQVPDPNRLERFMLPLWNE